MKEKKIKLAKKKVPDPRHTLKTYSSILAREILITESFVNRLRKETKRPIIVIGNGGTGKPYTWSIKEGKGIYVKELNYPSTPIKEILEKARVDVRNVFKFSDKIRKEQKNKPLIVFVDASSEPRIPSSFSGGPNSLYVNKEKSLSEFLKENKKTIQILGYDWSTKNGVNRIVKNQDYSKTDAILFNPVGKNKEIPAYHDDIKAFQSKKYKEFVLNKVDFLKQNLFENKK